MINSVTSCFSFCKKQQGFLALFAVVIALFSSIFLQVQADFYGMRLNLADMLLPVAGLVIVVSLFLRRSDWPQWDIPHSYFWLVGLVLWMGFCVLNGYYQMGEMSSWALYNKFIGFVVLVCYFALGGWLARNAGGMVLRTFYCGFLLSFVALFVFAFLGTVLQSFDIVVVSKLVKFSGFMGNRNAYCVLLICATVLCVIVGRRVPGYLPRFILPLYLMCLPIVAANNGSRAGWIVLSFLAIYFFVAHFKWSVRHILPWLLCGAILAVLLFSTTDQVVTKRKNITRIITTIDVMQEHGTDALGDINKNDKNVRKIASELVRLRNVRDSLVIWAQNPIIGGGMGSILHYQEQHYDGETVFIDVMDCTPVWLLAETGLIGLGLFSLFYIFVLRALWRKLKNEDGIEGAFAEALFVFMLAFGVMSLFHEILYTRYLWVMMGMGVAVLRPQVAN